MLQDIFSQGTLEMSSIPVQAAAASRGWADVLSNRILVVVAVAAVLLDLSDMMGIFPQTRDCLRRAKGNVNMEHSLSVARSRNLSALVCALPFCLVADRLGLYGAAWMGEVPPGWSVAAIAGVLTAYMTLRLLLSVPLMPRSLDSESSKAAHRAILTYFIALTAVALATMGAMMLLKAPEAAIRTVILWETAAFWLLSTVRSGQILASRCGGFQAFLYLCGLEILPAGLLVCSAVLL